MNIILLDDFFYQTFNAGPLSKNWSMTFFRISTNDNDIINKMADHSIRFCIFEENDTNESKLKSKINENEDTNEASF